MNICDYFGAGVKKRASDIHLVVGKPPILRIDGNLKQLEKEPEITRPAMEKMVFSLLNPLQKEKFLEQRDLDFSYETPDSSRFRVNVHFEKDNIGLVARVISPKIPSMEDIGLPQVVYEMTRARQGLILVTGPTGCGKSTTLAAMIDLINRERTANIVTLEDPIEFLFKSKKSIIIQRQLGSDMPTFESGLKHALRQDPNVIMVGEMRDLESIAATITLAETGHLVFATLHTINAAQTVDRIIDVFPPYQQDQIRLQLSMTLRAIISQHLIKRTSKGPLGGRIAVREILINNAAVANVIRENKIPQLRTIIQTSADEGMISLDQDLERLVKEGLINVGEAKQRMFNPELMNI